MVMGGQGRLLRVCAGGNPVKADWKERLALKANCNHSAPAVATFWRLLLAAKCAVFSRIRAKIFERTFSQAGCPIANKIRT